ncbi:multiple sugar transport system substrate-binding protein [Halobacillus karajensis]|uniref:Uncharacterized protein n=1 Tax=Halobacillus karajensis TaxID=195088 RepID=A0A024P221_9BACI|nr:hypothetical protein [Halobacillus karajensis]CDQ19648.1 hypothetical protein BN982_01950 [Halobacillus karajensis]CDQ22108.1 hypothetical protein BN983_00311 [Halobacillus karajensis]CDQ27949.1 hypothetical protein BN981_02238 [Halobacillus karajensis]SEH78893.1 multiple sugar transport system substrate-binding protein [Halobacillus karajensis]
MLKKWMLALGLTSVLTLAACGDGEDEEDMGNGDQTEEQDSGENNDTEGDSGSEGSDTESEE